MVWAMGSLANEGKSQWAQWSEELHGMVVEKRSAH